jgi:hypothetical protein
MSNVFPPSKDIHETYDLKGSTLGRFLPEEEIKKNPYAVMKDLNWEKKHIKLQLGPQKRRLFISQLVKDVTVSFLFLKYMYIKKKEIHLYTIIAAIPIKHYGL